MRILLLLSLAGAIALAAPASAQPFPFLFEGVDANNDGEPDGDLEGWIAGDGTKENITIKQKPIGGGMTATAPEGVWMLEAVHAGAGDPNTPNPRSDEWRYIIRNFDPAIDLRDTQLIKFEASGYGAGPNSSLHQYNLQVTGGGVSIDSTYTTAKDDTGNTFVNAFLTLELDLAEKEFTGVTEVTQIRIGYRHADPDDGSVGVAPFDNWGGRFQVDNIRVEASPNQVAVEDAPGLDRLSEVYPNPSSTTASLDLAVEATQAVSVTVHDVLGREVQRALSATLPQGEERTVQIDVASLAAGTYLVRVQGETFMQSRRLTVSR